MPLFSKPAGSYPSLQYPLTVALTNIPALAVPFTTTVAGRNFKLDVRFGETTANGFSSVSEFHVIEEKSAIGTMYGRITEIVP